MVNIKTHKQGTTYCKLIDNKRVDSEGVNIPISQAEKGELDSLTITHQGSCVDLDSVVSVAIMDGTDRTFFINYLNTSAEQKIFSVVL